MIKNLAFLTILIFSFSSFGEGASPKTETYVKNKSIFCKTKQQLNTVMVMISNGIHDKTKGCNQFSTDIPVIVITNDKIGKYVRNRYHDTFYWVFPFSVGTREYIENGYEKSVL